MRLILWIASFSIRRISPRAFVAVRLRSRMRPLIAKTIKLPNSDCVHAWVDGYNSANLHFRLLFQVILVIFLQCWPNTFFQ